METGFPLSNCFCSDARGPNSLPRPLLDPAGLMVSLKTLLNAQAKAVIKG